MQHKGPISCKYLSFAALNLLATVSPCPQHELILAKKAKLQEVVGEVEEDELEGDAVVGPSREATTNSSGSTPLSLFLFFI